MYKYSTDFISKNPSWDSQMFLDMEWVYRVLTPLSVSRTIAISFSEHLTAVYDSSKSPFLYLLL